MMPHLLVVDKGVAPIRLPPGGKQQNQSQGDNGTD